MMDLSLSLENTHVLVTGGNGHIGRAVVQGFLSAGAKVTSLDKHASISPLAARQDSSSRFQYFSCDITDESKLASTFFHAARDFGPVSCCVALASLDLSVLEHHESLIDMSLEQWRETHRVNVEGTFLTARTWLRQLKAAKALRDNHSLKDLSLIIVGSESGIFGERGNADYSSGKSAVQGGLLMSLVGDVSKVWPGARVNVVAPGPVDTAQFKKECAENPNQYYLDAQGTVALRRPVPVDDVAKSILFLASESWSGSITGQVLRVDSGKFGKVMWMKEEC